jgi:serine phosphatase RsbU (regulator of sigma subunit)
LTLQRALMTDPPAQLGDVQIRVRYEPAALDAAVGGDWYDAFALHSGDLAFVVGDVAGHDIDAASVMGQLRSMLRGFAYHLDAAPSIVLDALNHVLIGMRLASLTTAIYARLTPAQPDGEGRTQTVTWSNAGHPPPLLIHPGGHVDVLRGAHGAALGVVVPVPRPDARIELPEGATLLLYTDGLIERRGESLDVGLARLVRRASTMAARSLDEMCDDLLMDAPDDDDIAMVAFRHAGSTRPPG